MSVIQKHSCFHSLQARGHVLLLTLFTLLIAVSSLALLARQSAGKAVSALDSQNQLQAKWATHSLRVTMSHISPSLMNEIEINSIDSSVYEKRFNIELGPYQFHCIVGDEHAKLSTRRKDLVQTYPDIARIDRIDDLQINDYTQSQKTPKPPSGLRQSWSQSFPGIKPELLQQILNPDTTRATYALSIATRLSPWNEGRLNPNHVNNQVLKHHLRGHLAEKKLNEILKSHKTFFKSRFSSEASQEMKLNKNKATREQLDTDKIEESVKVKQQVSKNKWQWQTPGVQLTREERKKLEQLLISESTCFSLWVIYYKKDIKIHQPRHFASVYSYDVSAPKKKEPTNRSRETSQNTEPENDAYRQFQLFDSAHYSW